MPFEKGYTRSPLAGRKKGTPNKKTVMFREQLLKHGCDVDKVIAQAVLDKDIEMLKVMQGYLPYLQAQYKAQEVPAPEPDTDIDDIDTDALMTIAGNE